MPITSCCRKPTGIHKPATARRYRYCAPIWRVLLASAPTTGDLDAQTDALLALLDVDYVEHQLNAGGHTLQTLGDAWESLARKLCGR
ncbi:TetR family transcriptional regulator [Mycobacterium tuberculosis]|nr:TetR family transcriptional regulator [Mycobacterium tuberculosis]